MKISIVMAVYDGEKYILQQLQSILLQTRKADEVIICDDCSTDKTVEIIKNYIKNNNLNNWKLKINSSNQGWKKNFYNGLYMATGDIIFFSDQDDVWEKDKLQIMTGIMTNSQILALSGCVSLINDKNEKIKNSNLIPFYGTNTNKIYKNEFNSKIIYSVVPGCTLAINKNLIKYVKDKDLNFIPHDSLFWKLATILDAAYYLDRVVTKYRIHNSNASGATTKNIIGKTNLQQRIMGIKSNKRITEQLLEIIKSMDIKEKNYKQYILKKNLDILNCRIFLLYKRKVKYLPKLFINNKYYPSFSAFIGDIAYLANINVFAGKLFWIVYKRSK